MVPAHFSIQLNTGRGLGTETRGLDNAFPSQITSGLIQIMHTQLNYVLVYNYHLDVFKYFYMY